MKLLLLLSSLDRGGAETHLYSLAVSLARRGHSVTVVSSGGELARAMRYERIEHKTLPLHSRSPLSWIRSHLALRQMLRRAHFDVIHAHSRIPAALVCGLARRHSIPLVTTVHAKFRVTWLLRHLSRWGDYSIAVSEDLKQYLCENYSCTSERIAVIPNGIDTAHFCPEEKSSGSPPPRLLYVSRLDEDSSAVAFLLCRLAPRLKEAIPTIQIVLVGGGADVPRLHALAAQINAQQEAPLLFVRGHSSDVREEYRLAHTVIGVSRVALEAASCGLPVILAGNEGFGGLLVPNHFEEAKLSNFCCRKSRPVTEDRLYDAILHSFSRSEEERNAHTDALRRLILRELEIEHVTERTLSVYETVLAERKRRGGEIVLCGYYGYGNTGDHALLRAAAERLQSHFPNASFCALTAHGKRDEPLFGLRCLSRRRPWLILRTIRSSKKLIFGGGTLLQDRTSLRSLCYYVFLLRYAQKKGCSTELWANGLAAPQTRFARSLLTRALSDCDLVGLRDPCSLDLAKELCPQKEGILLEADLAEGTLSANCERILLLQYRYGLLESDGTRHSYAIIAPRGREMRGQKRILSRWLARLRSKGIFLLFVPLFPKEDEILCQALAHEFGGRVAHGLSEGDLVGLMKQCHTVGSMRLHGLIFANSAGASFVGFGEDPKIEIYCREHGGRYWTATLDEK